MIDHRQPLVVIVGPTAVGKTSVAIDIALRLNGEIISADSRLFYRGMDIGTAKPSETERKGIPHHMIDVVEPDETLCLAVFQCEVDRLVDEMHRREKMPILVGGSGQYVTAVIEGWKPPAVSPLPGLRAALNAWADDIGGKALHERLALIDPAAAAVIDHRNLRRTVRALEVIFTTGRRFSEQRLRSEPRYKLILVGLTCPRVELYARIDRRIDDMIAGGLVDEVKGLLAQGYPPELPSMSAIGYHEISGVVTGKIGLEEAVLLMKRRTRQFVRRQAAWFKPSDPRIHWFRVSENTVDEVTEYIQKELGDD